MTDDESGREGSGDTHELDATDGEGTTRGDGSTADEFDLSETEREALHDLQLGIEYVDRAYGTFLTFHHELGHAMDRMADAEEALREAGHETWADELRDEHLPAGAIDDRWTYELVEEFAATFKRDVETFEADVRDELADGVAHVTEQRQQRRWRERAAGDWSDEGAESDGD